jgi:hypothetical protein
MRSVAMKPKATPVLPPASHRAATAGDGARAGSASRAGNAKVNAAKAGNPTKSGNAAGSDEPTNDIEQFPPPKP